jgi:hypothetical protein
MQGLKEISKKR